MKKIKYGILVLVLMFIFINNVSAGYNGKGNDAKYTTITECNPEWNGYCQFDNDNHKTIKMTLYYFDSKNKRTKIGESVYYSEITTWYENKPAKLKIPLEKANIDKDRKATIGEYFSFKEMYNKYFGNTKNYSYEKFNTYKKISDNLKTYVKKEAFLDYLIGKITEGKYDSKTLKTKDGEYRIIIEPVVTLVRKNYYYAFTVKYLAEQGYDNITNTVHWTNSGNSRKFPMMLYTSYDDVGIKATTCNDVTAKNISSKVASITSGCGYNIIDIDPYISTPEPEPTPDPDLKCEIGKNDNDNEKYNWIKYNSSSQQMEPIVGGCCSSYAKYGITEGDVKQKYPQCFENPCTEKTESMGSQCTSSSKGSASIKQSLSSNYCYVGKKYYSGVIDATNRIFYGCTYEDSLSLPQGFKNNLNQGSYFIWPTNEELLSVSPVDLDYEITRTSTATCYAYQVQKSTGYSVAYNVNNLNNDAREKIKETIIEKVDKNDISVTQNGQVSGILTNEIDGSEFVPYDSTTGFFDVRVYSSYNQNLDSKSNSDSYRYYDNGSLMYLRYKDIKDKDNIKYYKNYPYMLLPIFNNFDIKKEYTYGITYETNFAGLKLPGTYNCSLKVNNKKEICICPPGTDNAGLDLSNYSKSYATGECSVDNTSQCAVLQDEYCNNKTISYKCPNIDYDLTSCINEKLNADSEKNKIKAYNECVDEKCECSSDDCDYEEVCEPKTKDKDSIIYRTIFLNNPFLEQDGSIRIPGANWGGKSSISDNNKYTGLAYKYISATQDKMYNGKTMYTFKLTPEIIRDIKNYNDGKEYSDFKLECDDTNGRCYSEFLHNNLEEIISGTCGSIKGKKNFQAKFYSCREEAIR